MFKKCYQCKQVKSIEDYEPKQYPRGNWGTYTRCILCRVEYNNTTHKSNTIIQEERET